MADKKGPWYFGKGLIIFALCSVGPLALPLIWFRPKTSQQWKIGLTMGVLMLSWLLYEITLESIRNIEAYYKLIEGL